MEFSGEVLRTPSKLPNDQKPKYEVGSKVIGAAQGAYATKICAAEENLRPVPAGWNPVDAAGLFVTGPTSYAALTTRSNLRKGEYILIHAAAGGVGLAAVQIAKTLGATVIATAGTKHKLDVARAFGADHCVDYTQQNWPEQVKKLTPKGAGVNVVYDPVGMIEKSIKCMAWGGRLLVIGFAAGKIEKVAMNRALLKNLSILGLHWGEVRKNEPKTHEVVWNGLLDLMREGKFRSTAYTDKQYVGLESIPEALRALGSRETWGKVVIEVPDEVKSKL